MNTPPASLLRIFRHPLIIASILLLLVNDHILKAAAPSWLTGKLSDFAGLFFFPFLLALVVRRPAGSDRRAVLLGLGLTGALFTAIKTLPAVNAAAIWLASRLLGPSVRIVLDPSDLLALAVLPAAWWLWQRQQSAPDVAQPGRLAYAALALGSLAALATSPCPVAGSVRELRVVEERLYTRYAGPGDFSTAVFAFNPPAQSWQYLEQPEQAVRAAFEAPGSELPIITCDPARPQVCYRVDGRPRIEESRDGGQTWQVSWQVPPGREEFMQRVGNQLGCGKVPELGVFDLALLPHPEGTLVVAAAGNEGTLVRQGDGLWQRVAVQYPTTPTEWMPESLFDAHILTGREFVLAGLAALLAYSVLSLWARARTPRSTDGKQHFPGWALHPGWFAFAWLWGLAGLLLTYPDTSMLLPFVVLAADIALALMLLVLLVAVANEHGGRRTAGLLALLAVFATLSLPAVLFLLWAYGIIPHLMTARILALVLTPLVFAGLFVRIRRILAQEPPPPVPGSEGQAGPA